MRPDCTQTRQNIMNVIQILDTKNFIIIIIFGFNLSNGYSPANLANLSACQKLAIFGEFEYSPKWSF